MSFHKSNKPNTALWRTRRRLNLERKQVAWMLGHKTPDQLARYERGESEPNFDNAVRLSIVYGSNIEELFPLKYVLFRDELSSKALVIQDGSTRAPVDLFRRINVCSYEEALNNPARSTAYFPLVRDHVTKLAKALAGL